MVAFSRRSLLRGTFSLIASPTVARLAGLADAKRREPLRVINIVNFMRGVEPRGPVDLFEPVKHQMEIIKRYKFPATWLLQYDALVAGPFVPFLKENMTNEQEVGLWFEMNEMHCKAAGVEWRGRPGYEWDWNPSVAFSIGYTPEERIQLVDAAAKKFHEIWGYYPKSVASWNLDALSMAHFVESYGVEAFAVCRDQIATDGFTIWGAPIAGYLPSKINCWSPAIEPRNQINAGMLRMLGQDPVYYYDKEYPLPDGTRTDQPDTMEPAWIAGQSPVFVDRFLKMITENPCGQFAYVQLGQENNFGWPAMAKGFEMQMEKLAKLESESGFLLASLGWTGGLLKKLGTTPTQAQVQLQDPLGNSNPGERSIWYQSRFYRGNLHFVGDQPFFRDLTVYSDRFPQPFLNHPTREENVAQRMPAVLDGYHWSPIGGRAGGWIRIGTENARLAAEPRVTEFEQTLKSLTVHLKVLPVASLIVRFYEDRLDIYGDTEFSLCFEWDPAKSALKSVDDNVAHYEWEGFVYSVDVQRGHAEQTARGWSANSSGRRLILAMRRS